mgnify:CR=1 FL=1
MFFSFVLIMKNTLKLFFIVLTALVFSCKSPVKDATDLKIERYRSDAAGSVQFVPLEVSAVKPEGWLRDWSRCAAEGITGTLDEYEQVFTYGWLGKDMDAKQSGDANAVSSTGWLLEQCAYWLDGALRLGYMLDDEKLIAKTSSRLDSVVDGVLASENNTFIYWKPDSIVISENGSRSKGGFNNWAHGLMGRCLVSYYQATHDERILKALDKVYSRYYLKRPGREVYDKGTTLSRGKMVRGATNIDAMTETYLMTGNRAILDTMKAYAAARTELDYEHLLATKTERMDSCWNNATGHGVTLFECSRIPAMLYLWTGRRESLDATANILGWIDTYNLLPYGLPSAEEFVAGIGSNRHTETCDVPAAMWTKTWMLRLTGEAGWGDMIESAFLNAGPVPVSRDFTTVTYYQTPNRYDEYLPAAPPVPDTFQAGRTMYSKTGNATLCCVGSSNWIIPNYVQNMWMATMDGGLAYTLYGPCSVEKLVKGKTVRLECVTGYPFTEKVSVKVSCPSPVRMPLYFRVPGWCSEMTLAVNGEECKLLTDKGFVKISRTWHNGDEITVGLPMGVNVVSGEDNIYPRAKYFLKAFHGRMNPDVADTVACNPYACVYYGPLLYSLPLRDVDENEVVPGQDYGYAIATSDPSKVKVARKEMPSVWRWGIDDAPVTLTVPALHTGWKPEPAQPLPHESQAMGTPAEITLVPYNCTKFRVSMFPRAF